ncbi:MAG: hypothetical protein R3282_02805 [Rhodothermales bacterium]|nr:hypothetical protein [Rhodothermales bacterium]
MFEDFTEFELHTVQRCMIATADGPFFPDWEFETLFGVTREKLRQAAIAWPSAETVCAARVTLNQLTGYPHGLESVLQQDVGATPDDLVRLLNRFSSNE